MFEACLEWARQKCVTEKKEATGINIREALGDCVTKFRFSGAGDFARDVCTIGVLTNSEENGIFRHLADRQAIPAPTGMCCEDRLRPNYTVMTTGEIQRIKVTSKKNIDIKVISLFIGNVPSIIQDYYIVCIKYGNAVIDVNVNYPQDNKMLQLKCNSQLIIKPRSSDINIT